MNNHPKAIDKMDLLNSMRADLPQRSSTSSDSAQRTNRLDDWRRLNHSGAVFVLGCLVLPWCCVYSATAADIVGEVRLAPQVTNQSSQRGVAAGDPSIRVGLIDESTLSSPGISLKQGLIDARQVSPASRATDGNDPMLSSKTTLAEELSAKELRGSGIWAPDSRVDGPNPVAVSSEQQISIAGSVGGSQGAIEPASGTSSRELDASFSMPASEADEGVFSSSLILPALMRGGSNTVTLVSQAPLIDEPLGSGLSPVARGNIPPPPVLLETLPEPAKTQTIYEIIPPSVPAIGSDEVLESTESGWVEITEATSHTHLHPQLRSRRRRWMKTMGQRLQPLRPLNLFDQGLYLATEFTFLSSSRISKSKVEVTDLVEDIEHSVESKGAFGYGQRSILGLQGKVFGFQAVYWGYGSTVYESGAWKPYSIFEQYTTGQSVDLSTFDLEITQKFCVAGVYWGSAIGLRKMDYVGQSSAFALSTYQDEKVEVSSSAMAKNRLEGIGPTFALRGRKPFARFCSNGNYGAGMFWDTRVSWLWSDASSSAITEASAVSTTGSSPTVSRSLDYAYTLTDDPKLRMHTGLQVGFECWRKVGCRSRLITRAGFEFQYFELSDDYSMASSYAFLTDDFEFGAATASLAENSGQNLQMYGFNLLVGINY